MIFVYLRSRERIPVIGAAAVRHRGEVIVCLGDNGEELRRFSADEVWAYTREDLGEIDEEYDPGEEKEPFDALGEDDSPIRDILRNHRSSA